MLSFIDTHTHIDFENYEGKQDEIIKRALSAGVIQMINAGVNLDSVKASFELSEKYKNIVFYAVSIHPHDVKKWNENTYNELKKFATYSSAVAIGETGLDFYRDWSPYDLQEEVFRKHIHLARELNLPLIIHDRDAHDLTLKILKEEKAHTVGGVMHCFSGDYNFALSCIELGFYISFTGALTFKNSKKLQEIARLIPLERILIETDCPFISPEPHRGKRNEPAYVIYIAEKLALLRNLPISEVSYITRENTYKLFYKMKDRS